MLRLQGGFAPEPAVRPASMSLDPECDTPPEVLAAYAIRYGADPDRWLLLRSTSHFL
jgi:cytochrome oxidase Cu insertion factor (SCO1/SenC/PrrC family)